MVGRALERERKTSNCSAIEQPHVVRSTLADARGSIQFGYDTDSGSEKQDRETEKTNMRRQGSMDNVSIRNLIHSKEKDQTDGDITNIYNTPVTYEDDVPKRKVSSFATLPNPKQTTWQQQSVTNLQQSGNDGEFFLHRTIKISLRKKKI